MTNESRPRRILVVDDEAGLRTSLAANLELEGFEVVEAESGEEALSLAHQGRFDLVMSDIRMPGINGVDLFRQLRELSPGTPVVLMTGFALEELVRSALEDGAFTVLAKPFNVEHALKVAAAATRCPVVLIVDDTESVRHSLSEALSSCGVRSRAANDGDEAVEALRQGPIDVCVVDMVMPRGSGPEVVERLRQAEPGLIVIAMSGHDVPEMVREVAALGMHTFMRKPFRVQDLLRSIAQARGAARP